MPSYPRKSAQRYELIIKFTIAYLKKRLIPKSFSYRDSPDMSPSCAVPFLFAELLCKISLL